MSKFRFARIRAFWPGDRFLTKSVQPIRLIWPAPQNANAT